MFLPSKLQPMGPSVPIPQPSDDTVSESFEYLSAMGDLNCLQKCKLFFCESSLSLPKIVHLYVLFLFIYLFYRGCLIFGIKQ